MALIKPAQPAGEAPADAFRIDPELLESPVARRAMLVGLLHAKRQAMHEVSRLQRFGMPLLVCVIFVSALHVWETIAAIRPSWVVELRLESSLYHTAAALLTVAIDLVALYAVAASAAVQLVLPVRRRAAVWFFLMLTFLLNVAFVLRYAPSLPQDQKDSLLPALDASFVVLLPAFIPVAILAVENASSQLKQARLRLLVEITALAEIISTKPTSKSPEKALESHTAAALVSPGRPSYHLADLEPVYALGEFSRSDVIAMVGCGRSTADRLLRESVDLGRIAPIDRQRYRVEAQQ